MKYEAINPALFIKNRDRLRGLLKPNSIVIIHANDLLPSNADATTAFYQNTDLYYLTGVNQENTVLLLCPDAVPESEREILFVTETNEEIAIWDGEKLTKEQAREVSGIESVRWTSEFEALLPRLVPTVEHVYLATNEHLRATSPLETRNRRFIRDCQERFPLHRYERVAPLMHRLRMVKDEIEIEQMQKAIDITEAGFRRVLGFLKPGVGEWELEAEYVHEFVRRRSRGFAYPPIIGSGKNACVQHYLDNDCVCREGELVLMDVGAEYANWNADMTRTIPVNGRFSKRQRDVYEAVLRMLRAANGILRPGITPVDYQARVVEMMEGELLELGLFTAEEAEKQGPGKELVKKYFMTGVSHPIGLDVHDVAPPNEPVAEGMVFTIEPGIYIREEGLGVRLENNVVVGEKENRDLFSHIPIEADEIEELMNS